MIPNFNKPPSNTTMLDYSQPSKNMWFDLIYEIGKKFSSSLRLPLLMEQAIDMIQKTIGAMAASVLMFDDKENELYFEIASGPVGKTLKQVKINTEYGIAGHVVRTGKPLIVNDVTRHENFHGNIDRITGFNTKNLICAPLIIHKKILGVIEVVNKLDGSDFNEQDLEAVIAVAATTAMAIENTRLHQEILDSYNATISTLAAAIDAKDPYTLGHSQRVKEYALMGGKNLSLSAENIDILEYACILHDVGKISIDSNILKKPGTLNAEEWDQIYKHPETGASILNEIPFLKKASEFVLLHHERYDGKGYPKSIKGEDIPIEARLIAVADAFDTMTTDRSYHRSISFEKAINVLFDCSGTQFCPISVVAITSNLSTNKKSS